MGVRERIARERRLAVLIRLPRHGPGALPYDVAMDLGWPPGTVKTMLHKLAREGRVVSERETIPNGPGYRLRYWRVSR